MGDIGEKLTGIVAAVIGLAVLAIVISQKANTANVLGAFFGGISNLVGVAISPVTGQAVSGLNASGLSGGTWTGGGSTAGSSALSGITGASGAQNYLGAALGAVGGGFGF